VARAIGLMMEEIRRNMVLTGIASLSDLNEDFLLWSEKRSRRA